MCCTTHCEQLLQRFGALSMRTTACGTHVVVERNLPAGFSWLIVACEGQRMIVLQLVHR